MLVNRRGILLLPFFVLWFLFCGITISANYPKILKELEFASEMSNEKQTQVSEHVSGQANEPLLQPPHALCSTDFVAEVKAVPGDGLTDVEAQSRLEVYGSNELDDGPGVQPAKILLRQIVNAMILVK
ncbi:hypothetical protein E4T44_00130 [Aureobasidium sp. EXF-8845]|nr:hypothetical protein E4T44_00130 [Aureobasidium sp. EXF-8845]KAI4858345.1 hypothetical protein E4T45_00141 [Aureobasidium sp. EXF-8846]